MGIPEERFAEATREGSVSVILASDLFQYASSPFAVWCESHAPPEERDPPSGFFDLLRERGMAHEANVVATQHPDTVRLARGTELDDLAVALRLMSEGARVLHGYPLFWLPDGMRGRADLLIRSDDAPSVFGSYHYRVAEIKLAKNLKRKHRLQGAFYNHVLGRIQGYTPPTFTLINRDGEHFAFHHDERELTEAIADIRAIRAGKPVEAELDRGIWPWTKYTNKVAIASDDVSLVTGVGSVLRGALAEAGYATVTALSRASPDALLDVHGVGPTRAQKLPILAQALVAKQPIQMGPLSVSDERFAIFLDLEGTSDLVDDDIEPMDYLIGNLVRENGVETYVPFLAPTLEGEGEMMRAFVHWLAQQPEGPLYHWHHYEATHLKTLAQRHGVASEWRALAPRLRDLHKDATHAFAFPTYGTSLKDIAPFLGFRWSQSDVNAMESIALYLSYVKDPRNEHAKLKRVLDYNQDDCIATRVVKDWLAGQAKLLVTSR